MTKIKKNNDSQNWDIERLDPKHTAWYNYKLILEHLERYYFATNYIQEKIVADIGSGSGYGSKIMAENGAKQVISIDIDPEAILYAKKYYKHDKIEHRVASATKTVITSKTIDVVVCFEVIEHLENPQELIREILRILKPNGLCILSTPNKETSYGDNPFHLEEFNLFQLEKILSGFSDRQFFGQRSVYLPLVKLYQLLHRVIAFPFFRLLLRFRPWEGYFIDEVRNKNYTPYLYLLAVCKK